MSRSTQPRNYRPLLLIGAVLFAIANIVYAVSWMYYIRSPIQVEIGIDEDYSAAGVHLVRVRPGTPAEAAGLKAGDLIVAIDGRTANSERSWNSLLYRVWLGSQPGDTVTLTVQRGGEGQPVTVPTFFRAKQGAGDRKTLAFRVGREIMGSFPILFIGVGLAVLFLRLEDPYAWLLALVFATWISPADIPDWFVAAPSALQTFLLGYRTVTMCLLPPVFYFFFAVFPTRSPIDRKLPWLKWLFLVLSLCLGMGGFWRGDMEPLPFVRRLFGDRGVHIAGMTVGYGAILLGVASLLMNFFSATSLAERRKLKVILWGTIVGITPVVLVKFAENLAHFEPAFWLQFIYVVLLLLFPLSFAYAVVKHRVMDIPVLLKRSARYFVVERGFVFLILALSVGLTLWLGQAFARHFSEWSRAAVPVGATFGVLLVAGATQVHRRVRTRLDRAFFRSSYNAQQILEDLAAKTLTVTTREELATLLRDNIENALHPSSMYVYLENGHRQFSAYAGTPPPAAMTLAPNTNAINMLAEQSGPVELTPEETYGTQLEPLQPECLVPIRGSSEGELQGGIVLCARLSEEPYSSSDKRLLASVASQAGIAMRSITLAEKMAQRLEAERRAEQEMQIARQVQSRLLPQEAPALKTLQCAGRCIQTRSVGGDYYDFLDFGGGRLGLVLADISGKGISGALLMANLQANLRSQYALALEDIPRLLTSVNRLFYRNTEPNSYATAFFAIYNEEDHRLQYVNCGHNAPLLLRADGVVERLEATATVLGLFEEWECMVAQRQLAPGDVLVIYTDGISEASPNEEDEFGEERLQDVVRRRQSQSADEILDAILRDVQQFSQGEQADDMTLIVAKAC